MNLAEWEILVCDTSFHSSGRSQQARRARNKCHMSSRTYLTTLCMCRVLNVNAGHNRHVVVVLMALSCQANTLIKSASVNFMPPNSKPSLPNCLAGQTFYEQINWHKRLALWKPLVVEEAYLYCSYITKKNSHDTMATLLRHAGAISSGTYISDNHHGVAVLRCAAQTETAST